MKALLLAGLLAISSTSQAGEIFKLKDDTIACFDKQDMRLMAHTILNRNEEIALEFFNFMIDEKRCFLFGELLVKLVDIDGEFYSITLLKVPRVPLWTHKNFLTQ